MDLLAPIAAPIDIAAPLDVAGREIAASAPKAPTGASFKTILAELGGRMDKGEAKVNAVVQAAPRLGPGGELLALQAGVYRYTETFEVASKLVDKTSSAIKTTLQGQ